MTQHLQWFDILLAVLLLAFMTWMGTRGHKTESEEDFLIGGRAVPSWRLAATIAAGAIGGGVLLIFPEYTFRFGLSAFCIIGGIVVGTLLIVPVALRFKPVADRQLFYTLPDLYAYEWGRKAGVLCTCVVGVWTLAFIMMQLICAGVILQKMTGWPYSVGVILGAATVASYLLVSGFRAVVITDILQYWALIILLLVVLPVAGGRIDYRVAWTFAIRNHMDWGQAVGFFVLGTLNIIVSADFWQRVYAAKSVRDARKGLQIAAILILVAGILLVLPSLYARITIPGSEPNHALINSLNLLLPRWLLGFGLVGALSTVIATLDTMVFILGISIAHDIQVRQFHRPLGDRVSSIRITIALSLTLGSVASIVYPKLLEVALSLSTLGLVLAPSVVMCMTPWKPSPKAVEWGVALGLLATLILVVGEIIKPGLLTPENSLAAFGAAILGTAAGAVYTWTSRR